MTTRTTKAVNDEKKASVKELTPLKGIGIYSAEELSKSVSFPKGKLWGFISLRVEGRTVMMQVQREDLGRHTMYAVSKGSTACFIRPVDGESDEI